MAAFMKTCEEKSGIFLFNLIVYIKNHKYRYKKLICQLLKKIPCRVILLIDTPNQSGISTVIDKKFIEITINKEYDSLLSLIFAYLLPDLPICLFWPADMEKDALFFRFKNIANKILIDSDLFSTPLCLLPKEKVVIVDLNWIRTEKIRSLLLTIFHDKEKLKMLKHAKNITIFHGKAFYPRAFWLQNWLAKSLKWQLVSINHSQFYYKKNDAKKMTIKLKKTKSSKPTLNKIVITTVDKGKITVCKKSKNLMEVKIVTHDKCEVPNSYPIEALREEEILKRALFTAQIPKLLCL